jgi:hypothetical protein
MVIDRMCNLGSELAVEQCWFPAMALDGLSGMSFCYEEVTEAVDQ